MERRLPLPLLLAAAATLLGAYAGEAGAAPQPAIEFIRTSCRSTRYPAICEQCLSGYAATIRRSPRQLAQAALTVTLSRAQSASAFVDRLKSGSPSAIRSRQAGAVRDCIENVSDSVDRIRRSVKEMGGMGRAGTSGFAWHMSNVQTWVSAALTDENTCLDGLAGPDVDPSLRAAVRGKIVGLAQVTSNALALVNRIKH